MKRFYSRLRIMLMTFALGLASVNFFNWFNDYWNEVSIDLPRVESFSPIELIIINRSVGNKNVFHLNDPIAFSPSFHACGGKNGYGGESTISSYNAYNWQSIGVSTSGYNKVNSAKRELNLRIKEASAILENNKIFDKTTKSYKRRIILELEKKTVNIINYDGKNYINIISAPSLKLALEFEQWQEYTSNYLHLMNENGRK